MEGHLVYISSEYDQDSDPRGVHPISLIDCRIITELINVNDALGLDKLSNILNQWKARDDEEILEQLIALTDNIDEGNPDEGSKGLLEQILGSLAEEIPDSYLEIQNEIIDVREIFRIKKSERYDVDSGRHMYDIIINPLDEKITNIKGVKVIDLTLSYANQDHRNKQLEMIKEKMTEVTKCKFIK